MYRSLAAAAAAATLISLALPAQAQGRWELIGSQSVGFQTERDRVSARGEGRFRSIRICVSGAPVHFRDLDVRFANGERQDLPVNRLIRAGQCAGPIDLSGEARSIREIELVYNAVPTFRGRATVTIYGMQAGPGSQSQTGRWETLGTRAVGFRVDRDTISGRGEGRFRALRLCVTRNAVHFRDLDVDFGNGEKQDLSVQRRIGAGQCTPALDFRGGARNIRQVTMTYNAMPNFRGQAMVTLQGLH